MFQFHLRTLFAATALVAVYVVAMRPFAGSTEKFLTVSAVFWTLTPLGFFLLDFIVRRWDGNHFRPQWPLAMGLSIVLAGGMLGICSWILSDFDLPRQPLVLMLGTISFVAGCALMTPAVLIVGFPLVSLYLMSAIRVPYMLFGVVWGSCCGAFTLVYGEFNDWLSVLLLCSAAFAYAMGLRLDTVAESKRTVQSENKASSHGV